MFSEWWYSPFVYIGESVCQGSSEANKQVVSITRKGCPCQDHWASPSKKKIATEPLVDLFSSLIDFLAEPDQSSSCCLENHVKQYLQCRSKVLGHLARYYWNNLPSPPPPQAMLRFDTTTQISTKILFICIFQHCLGGRGVVRSNCDPKKPTLLGIHDYWTGVPTTFDLHCSSFLGHAYSSPNTKTVATMYTMRALWF